MSDDAPDWFGDWSDRHVRVDTVVGEVVVRDDGETLSELEETAGRLLDRAEQIHRSHSNCQSDAGGMHR